MAAAGPSGTVVRSRANVDEAMFGNLRRIGNPFPRRRNPAPLAPRIGTEVRRFVNSNAKEGRSAVEG